MEVSNEISQVKAYSNRNNEVLFNTKNSGEINFIINNYKEIILGLNDEIEHLRKKNKILQDKLLIDPFNEILKFDSDGIPMLRFGHTGDWIGSFKGHKGAVWSCTLNSAGSLAATGAADFSAKIWDCENGLNTRTIDHNHIVRSVDFNYDANQLITANNKYEIALHDLQAAESKITQFKGHTDIIRRALWFDDNKTILSISYDKTLRLWDLRGNCELYKKELNECIYDVDIVDNRLLLSTDTNVSLWTINNEAEPLTLLKTFEQKSKMFSASLYPCANVHEGGDKEELHTFVCGTEDSFVYKYNFDTDQVLDTCKGHFGPVHCVRYSPDGHLFASGSEDGTLRFWQNSVGETYGLWYMKSEK